METVNITGCLDRIITKEQILFDWKSQVERLVSNNFKEDSAVRICAIAEHFNCIRYSEKAEYIGEILELGLPARLAYQLTDIIREYYK